MTSRYRRNNRKITLHDETKCLFEWAEKYGNSVQLILMRVHRGWTWSEAITTPPRKYGYNQERIPRPPKPKPCLLNLPHWLPERLNA